MITPVCECRNKINFLSINKMKQELQCTFICTLLNIWTKQSVFTHTFLNNFKVHNSDVRISLKSKIYSSIIFRAPFHF